MKIATTLAGLFGVAALSACGGGGSDTVTIDTQSFIEKTPLEQALREIYIENAENLGAQEARISELSSVPSVLPTFGSVQYNGYSAVLVGDFEASDYEFAATGKASIVADFETETLTGGASDFIIAEDGRISPTSGNFEIVDGNFSGANGILGGQIEGTVTGGGRTIVADNGIFGFFVGENGAAVQVDALGDLVIDGSEAESILRLTGER